jgi:hypothetical protein
MNRVPLDLSPDEADDLLPVGTVMPFKPGDVPENWREFNGQKLLRGTHPHLYLRLRDARELWEKMGGSIETHYIVMPGPLTDEETNKLVWGMTMKDSIPMTLALKVERRVRD